MLQLFRRTTPRAADVAHVDVAHAGDVYRVALKRSASARRFTLRVRAATRDIVLTMPARSSLKSAREFAERNAAWMGARLRRIPEPVDFIPGASVPLRGIAHTICHVEDRRGTVWAETGGLFGTQLCVAGARDHVPRRVADHLRREARRDILAAVARHTATLGKPARSVTLRDTTSRWGSCTAAGALNFSWRLILAPDYVLDYLAAHEVAHLAHMDHSPRFWRVAKQLAPQTDRAEAWLKAHGAGLHRYGAKTR